ncbi:MAG: carbon monoxide dehydrogenase, partial [Bdellovibrionales bacterium]|nr:carbon monoxide dehydrogenase [Ramlibacter sp.]
VALQRVADEETLLRYTAHAEVGGKLASVGGRLVQSVAKKNADDFFAALTRQLTGEVLPAGVRPEVVASGERSAAAAVPIATSVHSGGGLGAPVPAWLVVFGTALGGALGYCVALLTR